MISNKMKEIRTYFDNTQKELSEYLNVSRSTYAGWENGIDAIPLIKLNDFVNYYGISLDYICGLSNVKKVEIINNKIDKKVIGNNLKITRITNNDTQKSIAEILKVDQSNYSKYELGKIMIHIYPLIDFCKHYRISIDWICGKTKDSEIK